MNDIDFEKLKKSIEQKTTELACLQELIKNETGQYYIPQGCIHPAKEDLRQYCTEW